ncbi:unnamed protein product [Litomosoides sigmodontis]|uniref:Uncharacterized protein n=1 Tax=Litomosoides sigmodontis TaxID=42156 RepID=A0A3P6TS47_LITSI|nr:unnamed protein product [Litomosoides sigmodontis]
MQKNVSQRAGFEPARAKPIGFQVQLLNHSDIAAHRPPLTSLLARVIKTTPISLDNYWKRKADIQSPIQVSKGLPFGRLAKVPERPSSDRLFEDECFETKWNKLERIIPTGYRVRVF